MDICNILVVEDDPDINKLLCRILEGVGLCLPPGLFGQRGRPVGRTIRVRSGAAGSDAPWPDRGGIHRPDAPKEDHAHHRPLRQAGLEDRVNVLRLGADDFIPKPFDNAEVLARVEAQLRRYKQFSGGGGSAVLTHGDLTLDRESVTVTAAGKPVTVTAREFDILTLLMEHPKKVFTREQLYEQVWGGSTWGTTIR